MKASNGIYSKAVTQNGKYTFTIIGTGENGDVTTPNATVQVKEFKSKIKTRNRNFININQRNNRKILCISK